MARRLDAEIRREWEAAKGTLVKVATLLHQLRESGLWTLLRDSQHIKGFKRFEVYVGVVCGKMSRSKIQDLLAVHGLLVGPNALSEEEVEEMGPQPSKAAGAT